MVVVCLQSSPRGKCGCLRHFVEFVYGGGEGYSCQDPACLETWVGFVDGSEVEGEVSTAEIKQLVSNVSFIPSMSSTRSGTAGNMVGCFGELQKAEYRMMESRKRYIPLNQALINGLTSFQKELERSINGGGMWNVGKSFEIEHVA
jgi:hypothetical protein